METQSMSDDELMARLAQAAILQGLTLDAAQLQRVAAIYRRNMTLAQLVMDFSMDARQESAAVFKV